MAVDFDKFVTLWGEYPADLSKLRHWQQLLNDALTSFKQISEMRSAVHAHEGHSIAIGYYELPEFNAFAGTHQGEDLIAISANLPISLSLLFRRAMHFPSILPFVGNTEGMVAPPPLAANDILNVLTSLPPHPVGELDPVRERLADFLTSIAFRFIFMHEMGHVWNGHTSLTEIRTGFGMLKEADTDNRGFSALDRQVIEMDADCYAARTMATLYFPEKEWLPSNPEWESEYGQDSTYTILRNFAIYLAMRCFDEVAAWEGMDESGYPPVPLRQYFVSATWFTALAKDHAIDVMKAIEMIGPISEAGEMAFADLVGKPVDVSGVAMAYSPEGMEYAKNLLRHWATLRPQLDSLKRGGTLAPVQDI